MTRRPAVVDGWMDVYFSMQGTSSSFAILNGPVPACLGQRFFRASKLPGSARGPSVRMPFSPLYVFLPSTTCRSSHAA